ncbi:MAG TPA: carboxypeptidase-like regulatory domain-containing protein [Chitinophagaceae bacterium]|nr:carboxypeptidase-like regulatory domain-containing protein [Chitinophagaceae bacterium]
MHAQFKVKGTVYDSSRIYPLEAVTVLSTAGKGTFTDVNGNYEIDVREKDSIWFSYLGKPTVKYPVLKMNDPLHFDIALHVNTTVLKEVKVMPRNYRLDSIQNRIDYAKIFDYEKPKLKTSMGGGAGGVGVGFDLDELIRMFQFRKNKNMLRFQQRLLEQEQEKFIDHRFNKQLVRRLTNLTDEKLDSFMAIYRPTYEFTLLASDYDFQSYIKSCYEQFKTMEGRKEKTF